MFHESPQLRSGGSHFSQNTDRNAEAITGNLHDFQERTANEASDSGNTDESFVSHQASFNAFPSAENDHQRHEAVVGEMRKLLSLMGLMQVDVMRKVFELERGAKQAKLIFRDGQEDLIADSFPSRIAAFARMEKLQRSICHSAPKVWIQVGDAKFAARGAFFCLSCMERFDSPLSHKVFPAFT